MENLKRVFSGSKAYQVNIIRELLAEENIESYALDQKGSAFLMGDIHVYVSANDYDKAIAIVKSHDL